MTRLSEFKEFYLRVVLPNNQSYKNYFNEDNFDKNIKELIDKYQESYGFNPFEENISLEDLDKDFVLILQSSSSQARPVYFRLI